jgi:hypothetical protein
VHFRPLGATPVVTSSAGIDDMDEGLAFA